LAKAESSFTCSLTERGWKIAISGLVSAFLGLLFNDLLLLAAPTVMLLVFAIQLVNLRREYFSIEKLLYLNPKLVEAKLTLGEAVNQTLELSSSLKSGAQVSSELEGVKFENPVVEPGISKKEIHFQPTYSGEYTQDNLPISLIDNYGLLKTKARIAFSFNVKVYPKTAVAAVEAAKFLSGADIYSQGEEATQLRGSGYEYADTRPYVHGDPLRSVDWKATARLNKLMVRDYYVEGGARVKLIFDSTSPDPASKDDLSSAFVKTTLSLAQSGIKIGLVIIGDGKVREHQDLEPYDAVALALKTVFNENRSVIKPFYELLDPGFTPRFNTIIEGSDSRAPKIYDSLKSTYEESSLSWSFSDEVKRSVIYLSCLTGDPLELLYLARVLRFKGWELVVLQPSRPWVWVDDLSESKKIWESYNKLYRILEREAIDVESNLDAINSLVK
jgi:hypothetical protein